MKTLQSTGRHHVIAIALLATTVFFNANAEDKKLEKNEASTSNSILNYKMSNLKVGMYEVGSVNSMKLNFTLTKDANKIAVVKLMDENGTVLTQEKISKKETAYSFRFDFSESATGKYFIEVTNGDSIITKEILKSKSTLSY